VLCLRLPCHRPWRDEGNWNCNTEQYVCDTFGYNLGGHDLMNKIRCALGAGQCHGHSGRVLINTKDWADDAFKLGFAKNQKDITILTKQYHTSTHEEQACTLGVRLDNTRMHYESGYRCSHRPAVTNAMAVCAYGMGGEA